MEHAGLHTTRLLMNRPASEKQMRVLLAPTHATITLVLSHSLGPPPHGRRGGGVKVLQVAIIQTVIVQSAIISLSAGKTGHESIY